MVASWSWLRAISIEMEHWLPSVSHLSTMVVYSSLAVYIPSVCSLPMLSELLYPVYNMHKRQLCTSARCVVGEERVILSAVLSAGA